MSLAESQRSALQTIFSFFLGLMVLAFVGVGVNTFYRSPSEKYDQRRRESSRRTEALNRKGPSLSEREQAKLDSLMTEENALRDREQAEVKDWARVTSIILVLCATVVLVISLLLSDRLRVITNGLLLGGLFTMLYGVGWVVFSGSSVTRFWVITFALAVAIGLGYMRFVRGRRAERTQPPAEAPAIDDAAIGALHARVAALEDRILAASASLAGSEVERKG
jgi:Flp pilus assembly protein TadB